MAEQGQSEREVDELKAQLEQVCDVLYNTGATRGDALTRAERALESYRQHIDDEIGREEDLAEALGRMQMNGDTGQYEATDSFDAMCAEVAKIRKERDSLRAQLTEAQTLLVAHAGDNEVLRAERDRLREELTRFLQWECGELAMSERLPKQSFTSGSPAKLGGAVSREELVEALRACATNQHPSGRQVLAGEFAHRLASLLERGGKVDG